MEKILIMTDSPSDINKDFEAAHSLKVLGVPIAIDGKGYTERADFTPTEYYKILGNAREIPTTSQINPVTFQEEFFKAVIAGFTSIIYVSMNKYASATFTSSEQGREMFYNEYPEYKEKIQIHCIPSYTFSIGYGVPVMKACEMIKEGKTSGEIVSFLKAELNAFDIRFAMYNLKYAKKSGRLSPFASVVGDALGIRPVATFKDGKNVIVNKVRGDKNVVPALLEEYLNNKTKDYYVILLGEDEEHGYELERLIVKKTGVKASGIFHAGASIVTNAGPKIVGIGFYTA